MIKAVIVDDEPNAARVVERMISQYFPGEVEVAATCHLPETAVKAIHTQRPGLLFLDIELGDKDGFEVLEACDFRDFQVIFITAFDEYAIRAFRAHALDYLLKPIDPKLFCGAVSRVTRQPHEKATQELWDSLLHMRTSGQRVGLPSREGYRLVNPADILYVKASGSYAHVMLHSGEGFVLSKNLKNVETQLAASFFLRINRSTIVNLLHLTCYTRSDGGFVTIADREQFSIGQAHQQKALERIQQYITLL